MRVLWTAGPATVAEVVEALPADDRIAYNSVLTTLRILERKGYVKRVKRGRAHVYRPAVGPDDARRSTIRHLAGRFFGGSPAALALNILEQEPLDPEEIARLRELIARHDEQEGEDHG